MKVSCFLEFKKLTGSKFFEYIENVRKYSSSVENKEHVAKLVTDYIFARLNISDDIEQFIIDLERTLGNIDSELSRGTLVALYRQYQKR